MKVCPKCKRGYSSVWQICGDCKVELKVYRIPFYKKAIRYFLFACFLFMALVPISSKVYLSVVNKATLSPATLDIIEIVSSPFTLAISAAIVLLIAIEVIYWVFIEEVHPDALIAAEDDFRMGP